MDFTKTNKVILFSYVPLLYSPSEDLTQEITANNAEAVLAFMNDLRDGNAIGCLWANHEEGPAPVFLYPDAHDIADHLEAWTEDKPTSWFQTHLKVKDGRYLIILMPQVAKSVERWKINFQLIYGFPPPKDLKYEVCFKPLYFISGTENTFELFQGEVKSCPYVGFMNMADFNIDNPEEIDPDTIKWLGPFHRVEGDWADDYFNSIMDDATGPEPGQKSIIFDGAREWQKKRNRDKRKRKRRK